jgi:hypothetical protein
MYGAGVLSGMLGIGSGAFKVLAMDYLMRLPMKVSTATSNFMIGLTAAASAGIYFSRGDIHVLDRRPGGHRRSGRRLPRHPGHGPHAQHHRAQAVPALDGSAWATLPGSRWAIPGGSVCPTPVAHYRATADILWPSAVGGGAEQKRRLLYVVITRTTRWCHVLVLALHFACTTSCGFSGALA